MPWKLLYLSVLLGLSGCSKEVTISRDGVGVSLKHAQWGISSLAEAKWKVGKYLSNTVSKNLNLVLSLPKIDSDDVLFLQTTYGVDAWLVRIIQSNSMSSRMELVTIYAPFRARQSGRSNGRLMTSLSFNFTYAASAISERFRRFNCPAFSHDKRLNKWEIAGEEIPIEIQVRPGERFEEKLKLSELVPATLNIGNTMVGEYFIEVALFNTSQKQTYSSFQRLPFSLKVLSEDSIVVDGCAGVHEEIK
jgi:hypothetical protein